MAEGAQLTFMPSVRVLIALGFMLAALAVPTARAAGEGACYNPSSPAGGTLRTVVLDPGHGGNDIGASNGTYGLIEKHLTLDIATKAKDVLIGVNSGAYRYKVCLTRTGDISLSNTQRAQFANAQAGNLMVLIHLNGGAEPTNYTKTFWGKPSKDKQFSQVMHDALWPALATDASGTSVNLTDGGVGQFASGALLKANMPATLTESVFLTNNAEAGRLASGGISSPRRQQIAHAIANGVISWFARL